MEIEQSKSTKPKMTRVVQGALKQKHAKQGLDVFWFITATSTSPHYS
jgi:hypothetical protein